MALLGRGDEQSGCEAFLGKPGWRSACTVFRSGLLRKSHVNGRTSPHLAMESSTSHPLLNVAHVREEDLHQLHLAPGLVLVDPSFPSLHLEVCQKRFLPGYTRVETDPVDDGPVDPPPSP